MNAPFIVTTDASTTVLGYILSQKDKDGHSIVICYAGRSLSLTKRHYTISKLELAAVIKRSPHGTHIWLIKLSPLKQITFH